MINRWRKTHFYQFLAILLVLQLVVLNAMAASSALHKRCHDHADDPAHECAVTMILHGGYDRVAPTITPVEIVSESPPIAVKLAIAINLVPAHLVGGVIAHAAPRGP